MGMLLRRYHNGDGKQPSSDAVESGEDTVSVDQETGARKKPGKKPKAEEEKDVLTEETLINEILSELKIELEVESEQDILLLQSKIKGAVREVKQKRNYAGRYTEEYVVNDLQNYISNIKNLAMYDYGMIGGEFQKSNSDNGISVSWESRDSVFAGIVPIAQVY